MGQENWRRIDRRRFLAGGAAAAAAGPAIAQGADGHFGLPVPPGNEMAFKVLRNGSPIGEHHLKFTQTGDELVVNINIALVVTLAGIPLFRYSGQATERWLRGVFQRLDTSVNDNGTLLEVHAHKVANGYEVVGVNRTHPEKSYPEYIAPPNSMPLTYWNKAMLSGTIINIQTAHCYPAIVHSPGWNYLPTANGGTLLAQRFDVTGKLHLCVWYDQMSQWAGLAFHIRGYETYEKYVT